MYKILSIIGATCILATVTNTVCYPQSEWYRGKQILADAKPGTVFTGLDLSNQIFDEFHIPSKQDEDLYLIDAVYFRNVNFSGSNFYGTDWGGASFENCDFSRADLRNANIVYPSLPGGSAKGCDFTDAKIDGAQIHLDAKQLQSTETYKRKDLRGMSFSSVDYNGLDFAGFNLEHCSFGGDCPWSDCDFTNASIEGMSVVAYFGYLANDGFRRHMLAGARSRVRGKEFKIEQLLTTKDFKKGIVKGVRVDNIVFPTTTVNLSKMAFIDCCFASPTPAKIDLTDAVLVECDFRDFDGLTLENVKSTWNYKHGRMEGIKLSEEIQKSLDAEKEQ